MHPSQIERKIVRFRILIIGRANAGKTTILKRVCNTKENPEIFNSAGEKIDVVLKESRGRGEHDIEDEMVFRKNRGFVFHDSRGFEAGGESEYDKVNAFIAARSKKGNMKDRIHTIWYCIPMDQASRAFTEAELKFFSHCDTGSIPVIVIFTKFDALYDVEFARLRKEGKTRKEAKKLAPKHAEETFANWSQLEFLYHSKDIRRPPKCHVCLPDMNEDDADCGLLIKRTAETLDSEVLQQLFVSTQQTNLEICMKYAVVLALEGFVVSHEKIPPKNAILRLGSWFPHILGVRPLILVGARAMLIQAIDHYSQYVSGVSVLILV
ncbi:hypothetical protein DEU56DRAFT_498043 [Suillus clintonianus]|uniref:uncharacterized protein n=1 Tax=Suillus clintonianus TaxID=1904413 RepID=UPI001B874D71|nr:uncharacterized protein DEU56DRAFT_498043 [Suillus clintonianus]KAG2129107.1 hypothetical protein DEU56DRAFT_498043 [Suillus clintonianus]